MNVLVTKTINHDSFNQKKNFVVFTRPQQDVTGSRQTKLFLRLRISSRSWNLRVTLVGSSKTLMTTDSGQGL